jgi:hypothetical protein
VCKNRCVVRDHNIYTSLIKAQAHFDECRTTESAAAWSLGVIAIEMIQNGIPPEEDGKFVLKHPDRWSPEASNFLEVTSWGTLKEIQKVRDPLAALSLLINFVLASISSACIANCYDSIHSLCRLGYYRKSKFEDVGFSYSFVISCD